MSVKCLILISYYICIVLSYSESRRVNRNNIVREARARRFHDHIVLITAQVIVIREREKRVLVTNRYNNYNFKIMSVK